MYINIPERTLATWANSLTETELAAVQEVTNCCEMDNELTPDEVLDALVIWYGGLATAYQVKSLISRIYGIEL